jgi:hypothetical protein
MQIFGFYENRECGKFQNPFLEVRIRKKFPTAFKNQITVHEIQIGFGQTKYFSVGL